LAVIQAVQIDLANPITNDFGNAVSFAKHDYRGMMEAIIYFRNDSGVRDGNPAWKKQLPSRYPERFLPLPGRVP
jgi:hypothetical protein